jgi:hypothetical protein
MENAQKPHPTKVAVMDQKPADEPVDAVLVNEDGFWCIRALRPIEILTVKETREILEAVRDKRSC